MLTQIERRITDLHGRLSLRPTLDAVVKIGKLLQEAKAIIPHGDFRQWCRKVGLAPRTAQTYMQVAKAQASALFDSSMSLDTFLALVRKAGKQGRMQQRLDDREEARQANHQQRVLHADNRRYKWPSVDAVATDPPWAEMKCYEWLATFCLTHLRPGGLALVQCGTPDIAHILTLFSGMKYLWTLVIVYPQVTTRPLLLFHPVYRPVLVFSKGQPDTEGLRAIGDVSTVYKQEERLHPWQQPLQPWVRWIEALTLPTMLVADPFAGAGTIGVACRITGREYLGTEKDRETAQIATARIAGS